jgi:RimJ/RimL family protein N-acetyltransferase
VADRVLHTERLVLRPLTPLAARRLLVSSTPDGFPGAEDRQLLEAVAARADDEVEGTYVVELAGEPVGTLGVSGQLSPDGDQELGYALVPSARGRGLGTEAVGALCAVLERRPGVRRLTAEVRPGNEASLRLLHRLGFVEDDGGSTGHQLLARTPAGSGSLTRRIVGKHVC